MKPEILFIHSAGPQGHFEGSDFLISYIRKSLANSYSIHSPIMPDNDNPHYETWKEKLESEFNSIGDDLILIGHSLGGSVLLKYLSESTTSKHVRGLFLVATPYWGKQGWDVNEFALQKDFAAHLKNISRIHLYQSKDDEVVEFSHIRYYSQQFPKATVHEVNHRGHLFSKGIPELIIDIQNL